MLLIYAFISLVLNQHMRVGALGFHVRVPNYWEKAGMRIARWKLQIPKKCLSHAGNRTPAAAVKAPNPNH